MPDRTSPGSPPSPVVGRRAVLLGTAALALAACSETPASGEPGTWSATTRIPEPSSSSSAAPTADASTTSAPPPLPAGRVYAIAPNEPEPVAKEKAVRLVEATSAWRPGASDVAAHA